MLEARYTNDKSNSAIPLATKEQTLPQLGVESEIRGLSAGPSAQLTCGKQTPQSIRL